jgi:hypothetical protein
MTAVAGPDESGSDRTAIDGATSSSKPLSQRIFIWMSPVALNALFIVSDAQS